MLKLKKILGSALAIPLLVASFALFAQPAYAEDCSTDGGIKNGAGCSKTDDQGADLFGEGGVFKTITNILLFLIGAISVIMLVIGGIRYTISGGDQSQVKAAKDTILYAIIGIIVALLAYAAVNFVLGSFLADTSSGAA